MISPTCARELCLVPSHVISIARCARSPCSPPTTHTCCSVPCSCSPPPSYCIGSLHVFAGLRPPYSVRLAFAPLAGHWRVLGDEVCRDGSREGVVVAEQGHVQQPCHGDAAVAGVSLIDYVPHVVPQTRSFSSRPGLRSLARSSLVNSPPRAQRVRSTRTSGYSLLACSALAGSSRTWPS